VPTITWVETIEVRAPEAAVFGVIERDIMRVDDEPDAMATHRPLDEGPLRRGFRWRQTTAHDGRRCSTDWVVMDLDAPHVLDQRMSHLCAVNRNVVEGGERWELTHGSDESTTVTLSYWRPSTDLFEYLASFVRSRRSDATAVSLRKRLAYLQFEAERQRSQPQG
jgi:hypothetical protein